MGVAVGTPTAAELVGSVESGAGLMVRRPLVAAPGSNCTAVFGTTAIESFRASGQLGEDMPVASSVIGVDGVTAWVGLESRRPALETTAAATATPAMRRRLINTSSCL